MKRRERMSKNETQSEEPIVVDEGQPLAAEDTPPVVAESQQPDAIEDAPPTVKSMILDHIQVYNSSLIGVALSNDSIAAMSQLIAKVEEL
jgi:hypothetical protein